MSQLVGAAVVTLDMADPIALIQPFDDLTAQLVKHAVSWLLRSLKIYPE